MSVAELAPRGGEFERTPPHDLAAEQCVLGGMLMSKDAISDVMEVISPHDHYRPAHQLVHEAILELYGRGEPADPVTVSDLLAKRGELARVGGGAYLHTLLASVPTAANAGYYARIVRERAILRRLVEAGTRIVQLGYAGDGDADELVDRAEAEIYGVTERRVSEDYLPLSDIMPGALDEIEAIGSRGGVMTGVPTGFNDLDSLTNGLHAGQMVVIAARPAIGKALALDTPLPTPAGWTTMGEVAVGEQLLGADGRPVTVVAATEVMHGRPCYEVEFSDGEVIVADAQHQWLTWTRRARRYDAQTRGHAREFASPVPPEVVTTEQIARTLRCPTVDHRPNHAVSVSQPLDLPEADLPIPPYALGVWLGDGQAAQCAVYHLRPGDRRQYGGVRTRRGAPAGTAHLSDGVPGRGRSRRRPGVRCLRQHVPAEESAGPDVRPGVRGQGQVLLAAGSRRALRPLRRPGRRPASGHRLLHGVLEVLRHRPGRAAHAGRAREQAHPAQLPPCLRGPATRAAGRHPRHRRHRDQHRVRSARGDEPGARRGRAGTRRQPGLPVLDEHQARQGPQRGFFDLLHGQLHDPRQSVLAGPQASAAQGTAAPPPPAHPVAVHRGRQAGSLACRSAASRWTAPIRLYLAGRSMIPTHNSTLALDLARAASVKHGLTTVMFSLEMSRNEITMRLLSAEARVPLHAMRTGQMGEEDWTRLARRMSEVVDAPLFIDDSPNMSHDGDPGQVPPPQAAAQPAPGDRRLPAADELAQAGGEPAAGGLGDVPVAEAPGQGTRRAGGSHLPAQPRPRTAQRQAPTAVRPARVGMPDGRRPGCCGRTPVPRSRWGACSRPGERDIPVWALDERLRLVARTMTHVFPTGVKEVFRVRLASGRQVEATGNHPFLTYDGWRPLSEIPAGSPGRGATARARTTRTGRDMPEAEIIMLAHLLGDGSFVRNQPIRYASTDEANLAAVSAAPRRISG